jgi:hypothetical protein
MGFPDAPGAKQLAKRHGAQGAGERRADRSKPYRTTARMAEMRASTLYGASSNTKCS